MITLLIFALLIILVGVLPITEPLRQFVLILLAVLGLVLWALHAFAHVALPPSLTS